ncbi:MAG: TolC family protein [Methylotenera sp.]|uniref:TolC family protein n=1 Tax=Methylotenera sp. TaxID=2051956 RepID=UPI002486D58C|nr:TolC family protein [Methylotenera sp.]MDI1309304.1 TolC family protein [Methylotenera sp.]
MNTFIGNFLLFCALSLAAFSVHADHNAQHQTTGSNQESSSRLSLDDAIQLAIQNQPLIQSLDDASAASREAAIAEGQLPDPKLKFGVINLPINHGDALRFDRDDVTMSNIGFSQDVVPRLKRDAASRKMEAEADQYHSEQLVTIRSIQRDVALAWLDVFEAQKKSGLYAKIADEIAAERKVTLARISSGGASPSDALQLDKERALTHDQYYVAKRDEQKARAILARWIGSAANNSISDDLPTITAKLLDTVAATNAEIDSHPALQNARQAELVAQSDVDIAKAERLKNWNWEVIYGKRRSDLSDMVSVQVSIDLPWDRANRQDKRTSEKLLMIERAQKLTADRRLELSAELASARAEWDAAEAREAEHQASLIPVTNARLNLMQASYAAGKASLADVWEARRGVLEVEMDHWGILTDRQRAAVKIGYLVNDNRIFKGN